MILLNLRQVDGFSLISKRAKVDAVRSFPGRYGVPALKMDPKESDDDVVIDHPAPRKYPSPRILKDFPVTRDFPAGSIFKNSISSNGKSIADSKQLEVIVPRKYTEEINLPPLLRDKECGKVGVNRESRVVSFEVPQAIISRGKAMEALNQYHKLFTKLLRERKGKSKWQDGSNLNVYMTAATTLKMHKKCVNTSKRLGHVPGVQVGDTFQWRAELYVIGLHHQFSRGIDYMKKDGKILATCIVASGRYANDEESSDVLIYLGHGGNPGISSTPLVDQKLEQGNLALKNSMEAMTPVRVIRGTKFSQPSTLFMDTVRKRTHTSYVYDGLYFVDKVWQERGQFSKLVFKFLLKRISGQEKLRWKKAIKSKSSTFQREGDIVDP